MKTFRDLALDPFQRSALEAIRGGQSVIVSAPTGCGKTLIAEYAIDRALQEGLRVVYTAPIKALSNQKFRDFGVIYGDQVGIMTGDVTLNASAPLLVMTTEIFRNTIFESPERLKGIGYVIFDEIHYLDDPERGTVWEESIIFAPPEIRLVCLSATIANLDQFSAWIRKVRPGRLKVIEEKERPVPLTARVFNGSKLIDPVGFRERRFPAPDVGGSERRGRGRSSARRGGGEGSRPRGRRRMSIPQQNRALIDTVIAEDSLPCIFFIFSRAYTERMAESCLDLPHLLDRSESRLLKQRWQELAREFALDSSDPATARMRRLVERGIAFHHAGILPTLKEVVERLFTSGLLKLLFATETFALGVNMPARSVGFENLKKFDGVKVDYMTSRAFLQMAGRAGRRGIDDEGFVYANVFPHDDEPRDVARVMYGAVEEIGSQFRLSYSTILSLYSRLGDGIYDACEKSFAYFRHKKQKAAFYVEMVSLLRRRIALLQQQGYLEGQVLTAKGRFASQMYGYEIELTELFFSGVVERLDAPSLGVLLAAIIFEAKRDAWFEALPRNVLLPLMRDGNAALRGFREAELELQLPPITHLDWSLSRVVWDWAHGAPFEQVADMTDLAPGDIVRTLRMVLQLIRQLRKPVGGLERPASELEALRNLFYETSVCIRRAEVDAERQLRHSVEVSAHEEGRERPGAAPGAAPPAPRAEPKRVR